MLFSQHLFQIFWRPPHVYGFQMFWYQINMSSNSIFHELFEFHLQSRCEVCGPHAPWAVYRVSLWETSSKAISYSWGNLELKMKVSNISIAWPPCQRETPTHFFSPAAPSYNCLQDGILCTHVLHTPEGDYHIHLLYAFHLQCSSEGKRLGWGQWWIRGLCSQGATRTEEWNLNSEMLGGRDRILESGWSQVSAA